MEPTPITATQEDRAFDPLVRTMYPRGTLLRTWRLDGGISARMTALEIGHHDGRISRMIVRQPGAGALARNPDAATDEFRLLHATQSLGLPTPEPYFLDRTGEILSTPALVVQYIDGAPDFMLANAAEIALQMATHLAAIHAADCLKLDLSFLPMRSAGCPETPPRGRGGETDPPQTTPRGRGGESDVMNESRIRDALGSLRPARQRNRSALLHGDYWPGNLLWRDGRLVAVIDWEDASLGDPLSDLAIARLELAWIFGLDAMHAFTDEYRLLMPIDYTDLPYWDLCAALRMIRLAGSNLAEWASFFVRYGREDITEESMRRAFGEFVAETLGE